MEPVIPLHRRQQADLIELLELPEGTLGGIVDQMEKQSATDLFLSSSKLQTFLNDLCPEHEKAVDALVRVLLWIAAMQSQLGLEWPRIEAGLRNEVTSNKKIDENKAQLLLRLIPQILKISQQENLMILTKALRLSYDFTNLLLSAKLITDVRPIFNEDASRVAASVITFSLQLDFTSAQTSQTLNFALDRNDVESLRTQCDRALSKAKVVSNLLVEKAGLPTRIASQSD